MKRHLILSITIPVALVVMLSCLRLLHMGPRKLKPGDNVLLAKLLSGNGPTFLVIGHRTQYATEPFEVVLYKIGLDKRISSYYLAFEESFWWNCSIKSNLRSGEIEIRADGCVVARYLPSVDQVVSTAYKIPIGPQSVPSSELDKLLSSVKQ
jgi:hypothetical protein